MLRLVVQLVLPFQVYANHKQRILISLVVRLTEFNFCVFLGVCKQELVVEANPNRPPLSLLFFNKIAPSLQSVCHTHSSCAAKVDPKLTSLFSKDSGAPSNSTLRVVWKNVQGRFISLSY